MRAWQVTALGEPADVLRLADVESPQAGPGEVRLRVRAVGVNFADVLLARGQYQVRPPLPFTPGVELCGEVLEGEGLEPGRRVVAPVMGALTEEVVVPRRNVRPAPPQLTDAEAAVLNVSYQTAWFALHHRARLQPGETVVVNAAAGGVGLATVQLAKAAGARVLAVVSSPVKAAAARAAGAEELIDRTQVDVGAALRELTGGRGVDVVVDPVGGDAYDATAKAMAMDGRIVLIGFAGGRFQEVKAASVLVRNYSVMGLYWGVYLDHRPDLCDLAHEELARLIADGAIRPVVADTVPFAQAPSALARLAAGDAVGRLAVGPAGPA